uniref:Uncharacterized protein n=1 Tax=Arundo donax TaxID=35708 RepID=A0A0A9CAA0_ARUDO
MNAPIKEISGKGRVYVDGCTALETELILKTKSQTP